MKMIKGKTITVKTFQNSGISGAIEKTVREFSFSSGNIVRAVNYRNRTHISNIANYGNIGCGSTWIEIDGVRVDHDFFVEFGVCSKKTVEEAIAIYTIEEITVER
jgi:hypothetical protein